MILNLEPFMIRTIEAGIVLSFPMSILSFFVVTKKISFAAVSISHVTFGGVAIAIFIGGYLLPITMLFSILASLLMAFLFRMKIAKDSSIGIVFSSVMAFSIILISISKGYQTDITSYLFGNILMLTNSDIRMIVIVSAVVLIVVYKNFWKFMLSTFSEPIADINGVSVKKTDYLFFALLGLIVSIGVKMIGIILLSSLLILPASIGLNLSGRYRPVIVISFLSAIGSMITGIYLSWQLNLPTGASIASIASALFFITLPFKRR
ncbi:MAG: metal ABC transporter permease [Epsilonproteobacteria bacterium]|nr:metal ABC transporter permease [Campylobacterota bacterium]